MKSLAEVLAIAKQSAPQASSPVQKTGRRRAKRYTRQAEEEDIRGDVECVLKRMDPRDQTLIGGLPSEAVVGFEEEDAVDALLLAVSREYHGWEDARLHVEDGEEDGAELEQQACYV